MRVFRSIFLSLCSCFFVSSVFLLYLSFPLSVPFVLSVVFVISGFFFVSVLFVVSLFLVVSVLSVPSSFRCVHAFRSIHDLRCIRAFCCTRPLRCIRAFRLIRVLRFIRALRCIRSRRRVGETRVRPSPWNDALPAAALFCGIDTHERPCGTSSLSLDGFRPLGGAVISVLMDESTGREGKLRDGEMKSTMATGKNEWMDGWREGE